jgi:hypothetical protein
MMWLFFGLSTANGVPWDVNLTEPIVFRDFKADAGDTIRFQYLPPRTAIVFQELPPSTFRAWSWQTDGAIPLNATNHTRGFDTGSHPGSLDVILSEAGNVSFFAVTFPGDCEARIVSTKKRDFVRERQSSQKVCYFNGADQKYDLAIELSSRTGELYSKALGLALRGNSHTDLQDANASLITWSGDIDEVHVGVRAGAPDGRGFSQRLNGSDASLIEFSEAESWARAQSGAPRWRFFEADRGDRSPHGMGFHRRLWRGGRRGPWFFGRGPHRGMERSEEAGERRRPRMARNEPAGQ